MRLINYNASNGGRRMSEIRKDIVTGVWTIIAVERGKRPHDFEKQSIINNNELCPFCVGNESQTPPEVLAYRIGQQESNNSKHNSSKLIVLTGK